MTDERQGVTRAFGDFPAISPDDQTIVFAGVADGIRRLGVRPGQRGPVFSEGSSLTTGWANCWPQGHRLTAMSRPSVLRRLTQQEEAMAISAWRGPTVLGFALAMQLVGPGPRSPSAGMAARWPGDASLAAIVKPGDAVSVTPWSGRKQTGQVTAVADCPLALRTEKHSVEMPFASIKTVRRHQGQTITGGAGA